MIAFLASLFCGRATSATEPEAALAVLVAERPGAAAMALVTPQGVTFHHAGSLSREDTAAPTPDTLWEIGSITKVFTGILLADAEMVGKVSRNDPVSRFLLSADDKDQDALRGITFLSLTTHTSGLPRLPKNMKVWFVADPYASYDSADLIVGLRAHGPRATAEEEAGYSNFGVGLLGETLGKVWGRPYSDLLTERVLLPLGLEKTSLAMAGGKAPEGLAPPLEGGKPSNRWTFSSMAPAGALISSTREMSLFIQACLGLRETPLKGALEESMKPLKPVVGFHGSACMGWFILDEGKPVIWHNGATGGFQSFIGLNPATKEGLVILTNCGKSPDATGMRLLTEQK